MGQHKSTGKAKLNPTQAKVAKKKIEADLSGRSQNSVAVEVFPNQTPAAAAVSFTRELKNANVQEAIAAAMAQAGLTANTLVDVVKDAAQANRVVQVEGDFYETEVPDHTTRLNAVRTAATWLGVGKTENSGGLTLNFISISGGDKGEFGI